MLQEFFLDLAKVNGSTYSVDLYSALPTRVTSDFLSCDAVGMSFALYLDWDEARSPGAWRYACEYLPRSVEKSPDLVIGSMAVRKEDNEFARRRYINAYATAVYAEGPAAVGVSWTIDFISKDRPSGAYWIVFFSAPSMLEMAAMPSR